MAGRISQEVVETQVTGTPAARVSQEVVEAQVAATPAARVSQEVVEAQVTGTPVARASQVVVESGVLGTPRSRASQVVLEVLLVNVEIPVLPIYPDQKSIPGLGYNVKWNPTFYNMATQVTASGAEIDLALASAPIHEFELTYDFLRDNTLNNRGMPSEFRRMMGFFLRIGGTAGRFLFKNPDDFYCTGQALGTTDGSTNVFTMLRTFGVGQDVGVEPIGFWDVEQVTRVYLDGVVQDPSTYSVVTTTPGNQQLKFNSTPGAGHAVSMDLGYFYYCKFPDNTYTWEKFMDRLWLLNKINVRSCRAGA